MTEHEPPETDDSPERSEPPEPPTAGPPPPARPELFFLVGPLRTGSSLMARCVDDHPSAICLCESEINRALFGDYFVHHHLQRMVAHGLSHDEAIVLLDRKKQEDVDSLIHWYCEVWPRLCEVHQPFNPVALGDKSPDFFRSPEIVDHFVLNYRLIYTVRDPRAILCSIEAQSDVSAAEKAERWDSLLGNYLAWRPYLDAANVLSVRYEDLVTQPDDTMRRVYSHLNLRPSWRFMAAFRRPFPERFLWPTAVDWESGVAKDFDLSRIGTWKEKLTGEQLDRILAEPVAVDFMQRYRYEI